MVTSMTDKTTSRVAQFIASILPGVFLIGYNVGTGSVTAMSKAGAYFGLDLLWAVLVSCLITYYLILLFSRYTMVTGETAIEGFRKQIHPSFAIALIVALSIIIITALIGVLGIVADALEQWSTLWSPEGVSAKVWAILIAVSLYLLLWHGDARFFQRVLAVLVSTMGLAFIATMFINFPSFNEIAGGLAPKIPTVAAGSDNGPLVIVASMIGTTVSVFVFIIRTGLVREVGWTMADHKIQRRDARISASLMFVISAAVMVTAASTLHVKRLPMNSVAEMIPLLEPIAGSAAASVFVIGIVAAGLSSHLPNLLVIPWLILDYQGKPHETKTAFYRMLLLILSAASIIGAVFGMKPIYIMLLSQVCLAIVLPVTLAAIIYLTSRRDLMGEYRNRLLDYLLLAPIMLFACYMSLLGLQGLFEELARRGAA